MSLLSFSLRLSRKVTQEGVRIEGMGSWVQHFAKTVPTPVDGDNLC